MGRGSVTEKKGLGLIAQQEVAQGGEGRRRRHNYQPAAGEREAIQRTSQWERRTEASSTVP